VINGLCVGITSSQVPVYLAEITKKEKRGSIIVIQQLAIEWGILIMFFASYGCSFLRGPASFRTAWALQFIPAGVLMLGIPFLPRSPRWLAKVGRSEEAIETLAFIQANGDQDNPLVVAEWEEITTVLAAEREAYKGWRKFFYNGMWRRTMVGFLKVSKVRNKKCVFSKLHCACLSSIIPSALWPMPSDFPLTKHPDQGSLINTSPSKPGSRCQR
jgi:MFS family permease